jgi:predicted DNA-binding protein
VTTGYLERLQESVRSLVDRPPRDAEERAELLAVKETLERIDKTVSERLEDLSGERGRTEREEIKGAVVEHIEGLKQTVQDLALKVDNASAQSNVLAKLDALAEGISTDSGAPTLDPSMMEGFVQQIKDHVSSLQAPTLDAPPMDTSEVMMKLDSIATAVANVPLQVDLSNIQKALEEMRERSQSRQDPDAPSNSVAAQVDLSDVLAKLDGISTMCQSFTGAKADSQTDSDDTEGVKQETQGKVSAWVLNLDMTFEYMSNKSQSYWLLCEKMQSTALRRRNKRRSLFGIPMWASPTRYNLWNDA